ncbi:hypothetical protein [Daejeonella sp.]|jgi:hypothetical protein|uniref:hypothetical protein n=1 Tax=Daejeonella sp. TaxID=2805397 RepID=UPI003782E010
MKANKSKISDKADKKTAQKTVKKELEISITHKFLDALKGLGYDAENFSKEVKKTSKELAKKISKKYNEVKLAVEDKLVKQAEEIKIKRIKSSVTTKAKAPLKPAKKPLISSSNLIKDKKVVVAKTPAVTAKKVTKVSNTRAPKTVTKVATVETKTVSVKKVEGAKALPRTNKASAASPKVLKNKD